jgi:hypothetical protein
VLDDVERWRFFIDPTRKNASPPAIGLLHVELNKGAGQLLILPWRAGFAGLQAHDRILYPERLARLHGEVAYDPVALVEKAQHRDSLRHRRDASNGGGARHCVDRRTAGAVLAPVPIAGVQSKRDKQNGNRETHAQSGFHA